MAYLIIYYMKNIIIKMNMKKNPMMKKGSIADDIERLKQRREDRKNKGNSENPKGNEKVESGKCDSEYENLMRKKKIQFNQEPENVLFSFLI
jgi:hypothetical protein